MPQTLRLPVEGMTCAGCARHVKEALEEVDGVRSVDVLLASERAVVVADEPGVDVAALRAADERAGDRVGGTVEAPSAAGPGAPHPDTAAGRGAATGSVGQHPYTAAGTVSAAEADGARLPDAPSRVLSVLGLAVGLVVSVVVVGELLGGFRALTDRVPLWAGSLVVGLVGWPAFVQVARAAARGKVVSHTLMTLGVLAALVVGQWPTAAVVALLMRFGDWVERFTMDRGRGAVRELAELAPDTARVLRDGREVQVAASSLVPGDRIVVRPGERIPADGRVVEGRAAVNQAAITGESVPVDAEPGTRVFAASLMEGGALEVEVESVGEASTFGQVVRMVEEAEGNRADVERVADAFSARYLPVVLLVAAATLVLRRDPLATAAVLVVACSCAFALATPIAVLASVGTAARRGLLVKGGRYLEALARADVLLLDKTGTLTLGRPTVVEVLPLGPVDRDTVLALAAAVERGSEHALARAIREAAEGLPLPAVEPGSFESITGLGVRARVAGRAVEVGSPRFLDGGESPAVAELQARGCTAVMVRRDGEAVGVVALTDTVRPEVPAALQAIREMGVRDIRLLTGDAGPVAAAVAASLDLDYRAELLPGDKIEIVRTLQAEGHRVVMVGDGVNDAPALAQADVGIAMGAAGTDVALEAAHVAVMRDDWSLVPEAFRIARRTMGVIRTNLGFTTAYNAVGLTLAALGFLPPILAAAAQSLPDIGILGNSARLLRQRD